MTEKVTPPEFHKRYPQLGTGPVSTDIYWKPEIFRKELEDIFRPGWHFVGRQEQITEAGNFIVKELVTFATSVLVVRGEDTKIRAFLNACAHRGNQLELEDDGRRGAFRCKFHGWSYNLDGSIRHIPDIEGFPGLDCKKLKLRQLSMDMWEGFIFVSLEDEPQQTLQEYLGTQAADLVGYPFEKGVTRFQLECVVDVNWKTLIDSFNESYHLPVLHKRTIESTMAGPDNPFGRAGDVRIKGMHRTFSQRGNWKFTPKPVQGLAMKYSPGIPITSVGKEGAREDPESRPKGINQSRSPNWLFDVNVFFPNLICTIAPSMYLIHQMCPLAANKTQWELTGYLYPATNAAQRFGQEHTIVELRDVVLEDFRLLERQQKNMETGLIKEIHFHDHEIALRYHNYTVQSKLNGTRNEVAEATT